MSRRMSRARYRMGRLTRFSRQFSMVLVIGLALVLIACVTTRKSDITATPTGTAAQTPAATATATPSAVTPTTPPKPPATPTPTPVSKTWRIMPSPNSTHYSQNRLMAMSALSPTDAWAVGGTFAEGGPVQSLTEHWNGTNWTIIPSPGAGFLNGVATVSVRNVWAVGGVRDYRSPGEQSTQIERWNGTQWTLVPSPAGYELTSITALAANDLWAVGSHVTSDGARLPFIERWNGTEWRVIASPPLAGATESTLNAITTIPGTRQLWAVGYVLKGPRPAYEQALIEWWDGSTWHMVTSAAPVGSKAARLTGVVALSPTNAWAVGDYTEATSGKVKALIEHWNGTAWQVIPSPDRRGMLASVAAAGARDVWAVGAFFASDTGAQQALIEHWDGSAWHTITAPTPDGAQYSNLNDIATDGAGNVWAVGSYRDGAGHEKTLIERYS